MSSQIRKLRRTQGLTQKELARRSGVSPSTVAKLERGVNCRGTSKRKVMKALGLSFHADRGWALEEQDHHRVTLTMETKVVHYLEEAIGQLQMTNVAQTPQRHLVSRILEAIYDEELSLEVTLRDVLA